MAAVYIHIPFCKSKCGYCDFLSVSGDESLYEAYKNTLINEIKNCKELKEIQIETIFIGGGTPTVLPPVYLFEIMDAITFTSNNISKEVEITVEANPGTLKYGTLFILKQAGVNRLSMGLQACQNNLLQKIGRTHNYEDFLKNYNDAVKMGFENINVDLMFSLPEQTVQNWTQTLNNISNLTPSHVSTYSLKVEEGTPFYQMHKNGEIVIDEDLDREMYYLAKEILQSNGYNHYEISNFSKRGFESKHNVMYWKRKDVLGFGLGAHSFFEGKRYHNTKNFDEYIESNGVRKSITENIIDIKKADSIEEYMFLGLRMLDGISIEEFETLFSENILDIYGDKLRKLGKEGLIKRNGDKILLTERGIDVSNIVFTEFLFD